MKDTEHFSGHMLSIRRRTMGFSMEALAKKIGISRPAVWKWEHNECGPAPRHLVKLAKALKINPKHLLLP